MSFGRASAVCGGVAAAAVCNRYAGFGPFSRDASCEKGIAWPWSARDHRTESWSLNNNTPRPRPDLPMVTFDELQKHSSLETGVWISHGTSVYNLTDFVSGHPGGMDRILMAAGTGVEPFWDVYRLHMRGHVINLIENKYRCGTLSAADAAIAAKARIFDDYHLNDPPRHKFNSTSTHKPYCGEARIDLLTKSYLTPNELFYTRNHNNCGALTEEDYELEIAGQGIPHGKTYTLADLKKFPKHEVVSVVQCAGNRGEDYHGRGGGVSRGTFLAPHWSCGAISNGKWGGVKLRDLLKDCGVDVDGVALGTAHMGNLQHVWFEAYDATETGENYTASTFIDKVLDPHGDVIVAYEMNDRPLPRDHGYPARIILPGHAGARQPKWIKSITLSATPYGVMDCLQFPPHITFEEHLQQWPALKAFGGSFEKFSEYRDRNVVQEMPVQSLICQPPQNATIGANGMTSITLEGIAWSGGGSGIKRVDVSVDGGTTWRDASLFKPVEQHRRGNWGWTQFFMEVPLPESVQAELRKGKKAELELTSKAVDAHFNVQPENPGPYVNARGVAVNHFYRVRVSLDPSLAQGAGKNPVEQAGQKGLFANVPSGGAFLTPFKEGGWDKGLAGEGPSDWHTYITPENVVGEPGIEAEIDWEFYRNIKMPAWHSKAKKVYQ